MDNIINNNPESGFTLKANESPNNTAAPCATDGKLRPDVDPFIGRYSVDPIETQNNTQHFVEDTVASLDLPDQQSSIAQRAIAEQKEIDEQKGKMQQVRRSMIGGLFASFFKENKLNTPLPLSHHVAIPTLIKNNSDTRKQAYSIRESANAYQKEVDSYRNLLLQKGIDPARVIRMANEPDDQMVKKFINDKEIATAMSKVTSCHNDFAAQIKRSENISSLVESGAVGARASEDFNSSLFGSKSKIGSMDAKLPILSDGKIGDLSEKSEAIKKMIESIQQAVRQFTQLFAPR
jgi:hypothetical protein